jgi:saccharopine dehydrogenase-like NADP-dependent oxidoreductase
MSMRIVVLGGAGIVGRAIAADLARQVDQVLVADLDPEAARAAAEEAGATAHSGSVDVRDLPGLVKVLQGAAACVNSVNYYFNLDVMQACLEAGVPYLDLGGLFHMTRRQLELDADFKARGLTAVLGIGSCPGVANVQAGWLAAKLDQVDSVRIFNGATPDRGDSLSAPYAIQTILDEISQPAMVFREGHFQERPPLSEEEHYHFPEPIGWAKTHLSLHSEVATIPLSFADKGIQECAFKISFFGYSEAALRKLQFLAEIGLASTETVELNGASVRPRDLLLKLLSRLPADAANTPTEGYKAVVTEIKGRIGARQVELRAETIGGPSADQTVGAGKRLIAGPAAIVGRALAERRLSRPGVWAPEQAIEPEPFFAELAKRGFTTRLSNRETVAGP